MTDIVIRMSKVPRFCQECPLQYGVLKRCGADDHEIGKEYWTDKRPKDCHIVAVLQKEHGSLVDFNDVSKELDKYAYIVKDETTGMQYMEYPIVLEQDPIRVPIIIPATKGDKR